MFYTTQQSISNQDSQGETQSYLCIRLTDKTHPDGRL